MGQVITQAVAQRSDCRIAAGIDPHAPACDYPVYASADQCTEPCDVIIDFSHPSALSPLLEYAVSHRLPAVICTTGLSEEQIESIHQAARQIPIFFSANMSLGVSLLCELAKKLHRYWEAILTSKLSKNTTTARWMPPAEPR